MVDSQSDSNRIDKKLNSLENRLLDELTISSSSSTDSPEILQKKKYSHQPSPFTGKHLVVLQHGFLGSGYDMRLFAQAIKILCPGNIHVSAIPAYPLC